MGSAWSSVRRVCGASGVLVEVCTFKGGLYGICLEWPQNVTIRNNHFHCCRDAAVFSANDFKTTVGTHWRITGNTFDWDIAEQWA